MISSGSPTEGHRPERTDNVAHEAPRMGGKSRAELMLEKTRNLHKLLCCYSEDEPLPPVLNSLETADFPTASYFAKQFSSLPSAMHVVEYISKNFAIPQDSKLYKSATTPTGLERLERYRLFYKQILEELRPQ